jgi:hypothetical protein
VLRHVAIMRTGYGQHQFSSGMLSTFEVRSGFLPNLPTCTKKKKKKKRNFAEVKNDC